MSSTSNPSSTPKKPGAITRLGSLLLAVVTLLGALALLPATASAQAVDEDPTVAGKGTLWARGTGTVEIDMKGRLTASVDGDVRIVDHAGDLVVRLADREDDAGDEIDSQAARTTELRLNDYTGFMHLTGSGFSIDVVGSGGFRANGGGRAYLEGDGVYKTRHGDRMVWDGAVVIGEPQVEPAE